MKILSAKQIREADAFTIKHEPIVSIDLMERAANKCSKWITENIRPWFSTVKIFCGPGNNGGDGFAIGRLLLKSFSHVQVYVIRGSEKYSEDFLINERRLQKLKKKTLKNIHSIKDFPVINEGDCIIDAIFGTGLNKPVEGLAAQVIQRINKSGAPVIAIDIPSGLFADEHSTGNAIVHADYTLTFQVPKLALFFAENEKYVGEWNVMDIRLDKKFIENTGSKKEYLTESMVRPILKPRRKFSHKGIYGHALLFVGGVGKMGAAVLAAKACLRTGAGLTTVMVPDEGVTIMQSAVPEAMVFASNQIKFKDYSAFGIGPGIGKDLPVVGLFESLVSESKVPLILDADALNNIAEDKKLLKNIPAGSILTPHPKEFTRLAGEAKNDFDRHEMQIKFSKKHKVYVVLKGAHTCITTPEGESFFNSTGNPGMAKGGSGDVLTGMITSLLAQHYTPLEASLLGVYLHGLAGDIAATEVGTDGMIAGDIIDCIPKAFLKLRG